MPTAVSIKPNNEAIQGYYDALHAYDGQGVSHETAVRSAFQGLLAETAKARQWTLVPELAMKVTTDKRSGITSDPNRPDDPEYIVRLVERVVRVSVETVGIINGMPAG
jgi:hypothetical protein